MSDRAVAIHLISFGARRFGASQVGHARSSDADVIGIGFPQVTQVVRSVSLKAGMCEP
jgi:hypothetical protein